MDPFGLVYKILRRKIGPEAVLPQLSTPLNRASTWSEAASQLLGALFPPDTTNRPDLCTLVQSLPFADDRSSRRWSEDEVIFALESSPPNKAPGWDRIDGLMIRRLVDSPLFVNYMVHLYNGCLTHGHFPVHWKKGIVRALLKAPDKDPTLAHSYRPISLPPTLSKAFERLIRKRLAPIIADQRYATQHQFGLSAEDALYFARHTVDLLPGKYVVAISFDATAAFDNLWWPALFQELAHRDCPRDLALLLADYLQGKVVQLQGHHHTISHTLTKGSPQGSVLSPDLWNLVMSTLLRRLDADRQHYIAYADDLLILIAGNSRLEIERRAAQGVAIVENWATANHLTFSTSKTVLGQIRGSFKDRPLT